MTTLSRAEFGQALDDLTSAYEAAVASIEAAADSRLAFAQATELAERLQKLQATTAALRAQVAGHIWTTEQLSLAKLASQISTSKARAEQLVRAYRQSTSKGDSDG